MYSHCSILKVKRRDDQLKIEYNGILFGANVYVGT